VIEKNAVSVLRWRIKLLSKSNQNVLTDRFWTSVVGKCRNKIIDFDREILKMRKRNASVVKNSPCVLSLSLFWLYINLLWNLFICKVVRVYLASNRYFSFFFSPLSFISLFFLAFSGFLWARSSLCAFYPLSLPSSSFVRLDKYRDRPPPSRASSGVPTDSHFGNARHYSPFIGFADFSVASRGDAPMHRLSPQRPWIRNNAVTYRRSLRNGEQ